MENLVVVALLLFGIGTVLYRYGRLPILLVLDAVLSILPGGRDADLMTEPVESVAGGSSVAPDYGAALAEPLDPDSPLTADEWLRILNDEVDTIPHLAIVGPSGSGKSTFALALLTEREGQLVIATPKSATDDPWGGFPAVRLRFDPTTEEPDWAPLGDAIEAVYREANRRHADGSRPRTPLTLVVDELTSVLAELKGRDLQARLIRLWLMGRSVRVRVVALDPTLNVSGWGLDRRGDVRESIGFIRLHHDRSAMLGTVEELRAGEGVWLETHEVRAVAAAGLDPQRLWLPSPSPAVSSPESVAEHLAPPTSAQATSFEVNLVRAWHDGGETGMRALARRLYEVRGGQPPYDGSGGPYYAVRSALASVSDETLSTAL